jgi:hypothetical protein
MNRLNRVRIPVLAAFAAMLFLLLASESMASPLPGLSSLTPGRFSVGGGMYQAPNAAKSDSGIYALARYEISNFEFEIDYGVSNQNFFLGAADYVYKIPTAEGITQTEISVGAGLTAVGSDPGDEDTKFGANALGQVRFMDTLALQIRFDLLGGKSNLWTMGLTYAID